ncbi:MAG: hypothetical protein KAU14_02180 [Thermoplasmata archaeon]|nr:hypothetical protein [Thermoplasmata archaeon]
MKVEGYTKLFYGLELGRQSGVITLTEIRIGGVDNGGFETEGSGGGAANWAQAGPINRIYSDDAFQGSYSMKAESTDAYADF